MDVRDLPVTPGSLPEEFGWTRDIPCRGRLAGVVLTTKTIPAENCFTVGGGLAPVIRQDRRNKGARGAIIVDQLLAADLSTPLRPARNTGLHTYLPCIAGERSYVGPRQRDTRYACATQGVARDTPIWDRRRPIIGTRLTLPSRNLKIVP